MAITPTSLPTNVVAGQAGHVAHTNEAWYAINSVTSFLSEPANVGGVNVNNYGAIGDGVTDDLAALQAATNVGRPVFLTNGATYYLAPSSMWNVPTNTQLVGNATIKIPAVDAIRITIQSGTRIESLKVIVTQSTTARGIRILGSNVQIGRLEIVTTNPTTPTRSAGTWRGRALIIGDVDVTTLAASDIHIESLYIDGFDYSLGIFNAERVTIGHLEIRNFLQGVYIADSQDITIHGGSSSGMSPNCDSSPGENSFLLESRTTARAVERIRIENFDSRITGEHGYRVGGQIPIKNVWFTNCTARAAGSGVNADPHGGCGFKVLGPTSIIDPLARHSNIFFTDCVADSLNPPADSPGSNFAGFQLAKCFNVHLTNPVVRASNLDAGTYAEGSYAARRGIELLGVENIFITNPNIGKCAVSCIEFIPYTNDATVNWGTDPTNIHIIGGLLFDSVDGIRFTDTDITYRRVVVRGLTMNNLTNGLVSANSAQTIIASSIEALMASVTNPLTNTNQWRVDLIDIATLPTYTACRQGSTVKNDSGVYYRGASGWVLPT